MAALPSTNTLGQMDQLDPAIRRDGGPDFRSGRSDWRSHTSIAPVATWSLRDWLLRRRYRRLRAIAELSEDGGVRRALQNCGYGLFLR